MLRFDPTAPDFVADPHPVFAHLREHDPVHRSPSGAWVLVRHADVLAALADDRLGNSPARHAVVNARNRARFVCADVAANIVPFLDPPEHTTPRRLLGRAFHQQMRDAPPDVAGIAAQLLDDCPHNDGSFDAIADYGTPLALRVIADLLGIPVLDRHQLKQWSQTFFRLFAPLPSESVRQQLDQDLRTFRCHLLPLVAQRLAEPRSDVLSRLVGAADGMSDLQIVDNVMLLFADGVENVDRAIGTAVHLLLQHPEQLARWREQPELLSAVVDECLRFESPAQFMARVAREEISLHGTTIPRGGVVLLVLGAANRDPRAFAEPDRLDVSRRPNAHLAFGRGRHACIGGPLVELEIAQALRVLFDRFPRLQQAGSPRWLARPAHRWLDQVIVRTR